MLPFGSWTASLSKKPARQLCFYSQRRGKKVLVLDRKITGWLGLIAEVPLLKEHGVEQYVYALPLANRNLKMPSCLLPVLSDVATGL